MSTSSPLNLSVNSQPPLLEKFATCYKMLSTMRRNSELNARPDPPHPSQINSGDYENTAVNYTLMNSSSRFVLTGILDVSETLFPEFSTFSKEEQWTMAVNCYNRIFMFDACYRAEKVYPDDMSKALAAYTSYMSVETVEKFLDDCPNISDSLENVKGSLKDFITQSLRSMRAAVREANLDGEEFLAVLLLTFWFPDCQMREEITNAGDKYRQMIMKELHSHYSQDRNVVTIKKFRKDLQRDNYATRLGELFMFIFNFEQSTNKDEQLEVYRKLGVFADVNQLRT